MTYHEEKFEVDIDDAMVLNAKKLASPSLLSSPQVQQFIAEGFLSLDAGLSPTQNKLIADKVAPITCGYSAQQDPGNNLLTAFPEILPLIEGPTVRGALESLLGPNYLLLPHRRLHNTHGSQKTCPGIELHRDVWMAIYHKLRSHYTWEITLMYYPANVEKENGPTLFLPYSQFSSKPSLDLYATGAPIPAGTVMLCHQDLWHQASMNRVDTTRTMIKLQFARLTPPTTSTWDPFSKSASSWKYVMPAKYKAEVPFAAELESVWQHIWKWHLGSFNSSVRVRTKIGKKEGEVVSMLSKEKIWLEEDEKNNSKMNFLHRLQNVSDAKHDYGAIADAYAIESNTANHEERKGIITQLLLNDKDFDKWHCAKRVPGATSPQPSPGMYASYAAVVSLSISNPALERECMDIVLCPPGYNHAATVSMEHRVFALIALVAHPFSCDDLVFSVIEVILGEQTPQFLTLRRVACEGLRNCQCDSALGARRILQLVVNTLRHDVDQQVRITVALTIPGFVQNPYFLQGATKGIDASIPQMVGEGEGEVEEASSTSLDAVLEKVVSSDSNRYVRMLSAAALSRLRVNSNEGMSLRTVTDAINGMMARRKCDLTSLKEPFAEMSEQRSL